MENNKIEYHIPKKEKDRREYDLKSRQLKISRTRAGVVRQRLLKAYDIIENTRLDYLGDSAFREKITRAKIGIEQAIDDFLLSDRYWENNIDNHQKLSVDEYIKSREEQKNMESSGRL